MRQSLRSSPPAAPYSKDIARTEPGAVEEGRKKRERQEPHEAECVGGGR